MVSKSISLQELHLSAIGARWDFAVKLKQALETNPCSSLQILGKYTINYISTLIYGVCVLEINRVNYILYIQVYVALLQSQKILC